MITTSRTSGSLVGPPAPAGSRADASFHRRGLNGRDARDALVAWRGEAVALLHDRFQRAVDDGDQHRDTDPGVLARHLMTVANGIAVQAAIQAAGGATRDDLQLVADMALRSRPSA
ncbi:hypothetical protein [Streptomyces sp. AC555_RSS877]|uniref:hypothetical protein n=1 Tax=Streptomyces sp. AC555_RSS877 TaxID=2823688 RepID=UPI0035AC1600